MANLKPSQLSRALLGPSLPAQWPSINPGELRRNVSIEQPVYAADAIGGMSVSPTSFTAVTSTWAAIYTAEGQETSAAAQIVSETSHVIKMRYTPLTIKAGYRVVYRSRFFTVQYVVNVEERDVVLLLYCQEVDGGGA